MTTELMPSNTLPASDAPIPGERPTPGRLPVATYRLQFNRFFTFQNARRWVGYLDLLGVSDCYASPYFKARAESNHGYDIADHNLLNPAIGSEADYEALVAELHAHGMGQVLDIVPNHMGIGESGNLWWMDVLENGPSSLYAPYFDIDWRPLKEELENKVLLPILGQQYGRALENGELALRYEDGAFFLSYYQTDLPLNPRAYAEILSLPLDDLLAALGDDHEYALEYQSILTALGHLPARDETERAKVLERHREKEIIKRRLARLAAHSPEVRAAIERTVRRFNGVPGDPRSFDLLDALIARQAYRPSYWRVAAEEINYRRFFDINDLAAIRMEYPEVFEASHQLILRLLAEGKVNGMRIDHIDGLWDPAGYLRRLQERYCEVVDQGRAPAGERAEHDGQAPSVAPLYIVAEKILGRSERLPADWPVHGTSGYDYLNALNGIFVDGAAERRFTEIYASFTGVRTPFAELVYQAKRRIMQIAMASEVNVLAHQINRISERNRYFRDFTLNSLRAALTEVIACFPVYRTYIVAETDHVEERDRAYIEAAVAGAKRRNPTTDPSIYDFLCDILLLRYPETLDPEAREEQRTFVMKFQQITGPVMAKGVEDTTFYTYNRLASLNEVGGEPQHFGLPVAAFHRQNQERLRDWPAAMLATSTHDTKRSEDVRARINVLSELPDEWRAALTSWSRINRRHKIKLDGRLAPDRNEEYLLYQTLLGTWPFGPIDGDARRAYVERIQGYMVKAVREAKIHTSWLNPNTAYDEAVRVFVAALLDDSPANRFLPEFLALWRKASHFGMFNSLAQIALKLCSPGVPDIYQGGEMWDFSLVDPDNRRPVDYDLRAWLLGELVVDPPDRSALARALVDSREDGRIKLYLTHRALNFRRAHAELFRVGRYQPLVASAGASDHVVAFARARAGEEAIVAAPRLLARLLHDAGALPLGAAAWGERALLVPGRAGSRYRDIFTGAVVQAVEQRGQVALPLAKLFANFPVAVLELLD